jgi:hypothetical protein
MNDKIPKNITERVTYEMDQFHAELITIDLGEFLIRKRQIYKKLLLYPF